MAFHFRQFDVEDELSTMRVGTDAMLLGAWAEPGSAAKILDIGTGCGVLALMMAQKSGAGIRAIDIDLPSVNEARGNFNRSPWSDRLTAMHESLSSFIRGADQGYGFIVANPPWFSNALRSPSARKNCARHNQSLSGEELVQSVVKILTPEGSFALVLPADLAEAFTVTAKTHGLYLRRRLQIQPKPAVPPLRTLMKFSRNQSEYTEEPILTILNKNGTFSAGYLALTGSFHNF